jgi:hypothetical protein
VVWEVSFLQDIKDAMHFQAGKSGRYTLKINGDRTKGGFILRWETPDKSISLDYFRAGFGCQPSFI